MPFRARAAGLPLALCPVHESERIRVEAVACPLCGDARATVKEVIAGSTLNAFYRKYLSISPAVTAKHLTYSTCPNCGLGFFDPAQPGDESLYEQLQSFDWYYQSDKHEYRIAQEFLPNRGAVLEVGAGKAEFARFVGTHRYTGLEFNNKAIERAAHAGIRLVKQTVQDHAAEGHRYAAVVSFQVLEHVASAAEFIRGCVQCIEPDGRLIIGVPAHDGFVGAAVNNILDMPPHHVTHWTSATLEKLAALFGLELLAIANEPVAEYHREWAGKTAWESRLRALIGLRLRLLDASVRARVASKLALIMARTFPVSTEGLKGHTVVAVYRKP